MGELRYRGTVLLIEDADDVLEAVQNGLERRGYRVVAAHNGLKALTILASTAVDTIVLDLSMPVMSGWEFLDARSGDPQLASIPVVVVSGRASVDAPGTVFVQKPFVVADLVAAIESCHVPH
jgi:CheY-like chemotaxis protein